MNKMLIAIVAAVIIVAAAGAAVFFMKGDGKDGGGVEGGSQLNVEDNTASYLFDLYLGQKGSSEKTLINAKGTYVIPSDAIIIVSAKNPSGPLTLQDKYIVIPTEDDTEYVSIGFQYASKDGMAIMDSSTASVSFTPSAGTVNLGVFVTNYP